MDRAMLSPYLFFSNTLLYQYLRFLSVEPLLAPIPTLPVAGIDWVIVGGESGPNCRLMEPEWVRQIRDRCVKHKVSFFFKQWGGVRKKSAGRVLDGRVWNELPQPKIRIKASTNPQEPSILHVLA